MKYRCIGLLILLAVLLSCASRPVVTTRTEPPELPPPQPAEPIQLPEPAEPFEDVLRNIKMNTPLVKKYLEIDTDRITGTGIADIREIVIRGKCLVNEDEFLVTYDFTGTSKSREPPFPVSFLVEDRKNGIIHRDSFLWSPAEDEAGLLLSFDDHFFPNWGEYFDLFDSFNAKVTFFIIGSIDVNGDNSQSAQERSIMDFCTETLRRGHSLGYHTRSHSNLAKVSREAFDNETIKGADAFFMAGIPLSAFAYPYGFFEPWMHETLAPVFPITRGYGRNIRIYNTETIKNRYMISKAIDNIIYPDDEEFENDIRLMLLITKFSGNSIIPFTTHIIADKEDWGIKPKRLEFLLKTAQDLKLKFYTYSAFQE